MPQRIAPPPPVHASASIIALRAAQAAIRGCLLMTRLLPCLDCGELGSKSRCKDCTPTRPVAAHYDAAWRRLSRRIRSQVKFCEWCGTKSNLSADHVIPISEAPHLRLEPLNCRVLCIPCNSRRKNQVTDEERQAVMDAIAQRQDRQRRYYESAGH